MITAGSGLGAYLVAKRAEEYPGAFGIAENEARKNRYFKTFKPTHDPHIVQGGAYLAGGRIVDIGSAHVKLYKDAKATITGDVMTTQAGLLLGAAFGNNVSMKQIGTLPAYELAKTPPGKSLEAGLTLEAVEASEAEKHSCWVDFQLGVPYTNAEVTGYNYVRGAVTKAEFVFDRTALVSYTYDMDFRTVEPGVTTLAKPEYTTNGVPFAMTESGSSFKIGNPGSMKTLAGVRKMTVTLERKLETNRIYLGEAEKSFPITNALVDITVSMEADFTEGAKNVFAAFLNNEAQEIEAVCEGANIVAGVPNKFTFKMPNVFINAGAEAPVEGPGIIHNTMTAKATVNASNNPAVSATLITADPTII